MKHKTRKKEKGDRRWFRIALKALPKLAYAYFKLVFFTSKVIVLNQDYERDYCDNKPFVMAGFHGPILAACYYCRRSAGGIMVSRSFDGDIMSACLQEMGYWTARGSSSKNGKQALIEMIEKAREKNSATGMAVDAPRGPAKKCKIGVVILARETENPIVPIASWTTRHKQFNSWDKMILPLPFSTIVLAYGKPVHVPKGLSNADYERLRQEVEYNISAALAMCQQKVRELKNPGSDVAIEEIPTNTASSRNPR